MSTGPWAICDRCSFKVKLRKMKTEWTGLRVCGPCWDPRPAETRPLHLRPEGLQLPNARPEPEPIFREPGELGGDDL